jgi:DNA-binding NtrC family response regulator
MQAYQQEDTMRERLDCAVLGTTCSEEWIQQWLGSHAGGRLHVHRLQPDGGGSDADSVRLLAMSSMRLRRFDACLVPVAEHNLAWARTTLSAAQGAINTPVVALVRQLKAAALNDLYALGLADFVRDPVCPEELRVRVQRLLGRRSYGAVAPAAGVGLNDASIDYNGSAEPGSHEAMCANILDRGGAELEAFAIASATHCATSKESFRSAKSKVIERFERAYITAALGRHAGNIAMAARAAQKHRRAFWALMRKHQIDAAPFRCEPFPNHPLDG